MKTLIFLISIIWSSTLMAQNEFITTWEATDSDLSITIPTDPANHVYDYTVDFGDGTILNNQTGNTTHTYSTAGDYTVKISGDFPHFDGVQLTGNEFTHDLLSVEQWGNIQWESMLNAFRGCSRLQINASDVPDLSNVTDFSNIFRASNVNSASLNNWDVSNITNMHAAFRNTDFDQPLGNWNVSNVTDMSYMFFNSNFNQPLNNWDVSNVSNMEYMFKNTTYFNQPLDNWDVSNVTNMRVMFDNSVFIQPINNWDVSQVNDMSSMFGASEFNQPLNNWDVSNVTTMENMFAFNQNFDQPLDNWDVSSVTGNGFDDMFYLSVFNQDLSSWDFNVDDLGGFIRASDMDTDNFDLLLDRFVQLGIENGYLNANELEFCDLFTVQYLEEALGWNLANLDADTDLGSNCGLNYVNGKITYDANFDGCGDDDQGLNQLLVNIDNGQENISILPDSNGNYTVPTVQDTYTISVLNLPDYMSATPSSQSVNFTGINEVEDNINFCVTPDLSIEDIGIDLFPMIDAVPGFETEYEIIVENNGTESETDIEVSIDYDINYQSFVSSSVTPISTTPGSIVIIVPEITVLGSERITFTLLNAQPPTLNGGDELTITTEVTPSTNEANPANNTVVYKQTVINSFDPNDKLVTQGDEVTIDKADEYLDYKIRFQNVGTANALNVKITDTISDKLNWSTFQPINSSHDYRLEFNNQEEINFIFDNINLPYEAIDEPGSNGHVSFKIKPKDNVQIGDVIENKAYIFFDFNAPIITNTVSTTIVDNLGLDEYTGIENIKLLPNPASNQVEIIHETDMEIEKVEIFDISGRLVKSYKHSTLLDVS
ncbi:MAG: BspA family leucine-rich repeat surface protein, partial [Bacteroidetes bacterium]|nr:BspA family leucine-rich repeat surface protein [Bacteroidota bacterium]